MPDCARRNVGWISEMGSVDRDGHSDPFYITHKPKGLVLLQSSNYVTTFHYEKLGNLRSSTIDRLSRPHDPQGPALLFAPDPRRSPASQEEPVHRRALLAPAIVHRRAQ